MKTPRNAPCPCGSNRKWKKCCERPKAKGIAHLKQAASIYNYSERKRKRGYKWSNHSPHALLYTLSSIPILCNNRHRY